MMTSAPVPDIPELSLPTVDTRNENPFPGAFVAATSSTIITTSSGPSQTVSSTQKNGAMQLGKRDTIFTAVPAALVAELTEEAATEEADSNPWGTDDLIDINADQDDWSE